MPPASHSQSDGHAHGHAHDHARVSADSERRVFWVMWLTGGFMIAEVVGGLVSGSLALLADAGHMLTDTAALALAWFAFRIARRPADARRTYGYHRAQVLAAYTNGIALIAIVAWIGVEAVRRLVNPVPVAGEIMLWVAALGLLVNLVAFAVLHAGDRENLNVRGALLHVLGDLLGSVAAIAAALVILATGWTPIDPLLSVLVALLILRSAWILVRNAGHILLEGAPEALDEAELKRVLHEAIPAVEDVHHVHAWSLTSERPMLTLHVGVADGAATHATLEQIKTVLGERFGLTHVTVQIEPAHCPDERGG